MNNHRKQRKQNRKQWYKKNI